MTAVLNPDLEAAVHAFGPATGLACRSTPSCTW